ncbi:MAG: LON peptidase substrate-binding domain-containing protein [Solirubrobacterales bacterium]
MATIGIFELPLMCVPGEIVPLHVFEDRYRALAAHCLAREEPFGVLWRDGDDVSEIGCTTRITEVVHEHEDGRMDIITTGERPFRLGARTEELAFPAAEVEYLQDDTSAEPEAEDLDAARSAFAELAERATGNTPDPDDLAGLGAYGLAARVELPADIKLQLLDERSEPQRLALLTDALDRLVERVSKVAEVRDRASQNGRLREHP